MIVILDYKMGNAGSLKNMIQHIGGKAIISDDAREIENASALVLPGVGAFDTGMERLKHAGLLSVIERRAGKEKIPLLGICLGMQLLFEHSEEGNSPGLGIVPGSVVRFDASRLNGVSQKIPHMGWNVIEPAAQHPLLENLENKARFYFVHSYHAVCDDKYVMARAVYGYPFACAVQKNNIVGVQFHPEKSHKFGMTFFSNFLDWIRR